MQSADLTPSSCPAGVAGHTDGACGCVPQSAPAATVCVCGDRTEKLHAGWETAWIDLGGEG
jgi:hypothetical protein